MKTSPPPISPSGPNRHTPDFAATRSPSGEPHAERDEVESQNTPVHAPQELFSDSRDDRLAGATGFLLSVVIHLALLLLMALVAWVSDPESPQLVVELSSSESVNTVTSVFSASFDHDQQFEVSESYGFQLVDVTAMLDASELSPPEYPEIETQGESEQQLAGIHTAQNQDVEELTEGDRKVEFFGTHAYGNEFAFVLDISGSMGRGTGSRMRRARAELVDAVRQLKPSQSFAVVLYNEGTLVFGASSRNESPLMRATRDSKRRFERWIARVTPAGGTFPGEALSIAGACVPDAVFFLSDGEFDYEQLRGMPNPLDRFFEQFGNARSRAKRPAMNRMTPKLALDSYDKKTVVHTIALESEVSWPLMQKIAKDKGGEFRFIPAPRRETERRQR